MKKNIRAMCGFFFLLCIMLTANAFAADNISILKVETIIMEKGAETYTVTVKAFVKNNGEADDVTVNVVAADFAGFKLEDVLLSGFIKEGKTRVLIKVIKIPKKVYEEINRWEWADRWDQVIE